MKNIIFLTIILCGHSILFAQKKSGNIAFTNAEFKVGYGVSTLGDGLKEKYEAGHFTKSGGFLASLAAYRKFKKINNLNFGIKYKSLAASVSKGDNGQEMFFNYWGAAATVKYFPLDKDARRGFYLQGDYFFITQFTQKYTQPATRAYEPQYGLGRGFVIGVGYDITFHNDTKTMLTVGIEYEIDSRMAEQPGALLETTYKSSNFGVMVGIKF
jgi:hypothetical protein